MSFILESGNRSKEIEDVLNELDAQGMKGHDISGDELAKTHARYMIGGRKFVEHERIFRFGEYPLIMCLHQPAYVLVEFPERPGALRKFLLGLHSGWNISLFHYRNHGADLGKVLAGIQVPPSEDAEFETFLKQLGFYYVEETENETYKRYLRGQS